MRPRCILPLLAAALVVSACSGTRAAETKPAPVARAVRHAVVHEWHLAARVTGRLAAPLQDAAPARSGGGVELLGGLTAADTSTDTILRANATGSRVAGRLPAAVHDAAAANLGGSVYLFGGGNGVAQLDQIVRAPASPAGRLPAPSSDQSAAAIGSTAYVVGGYTGSRWLNTIVAFTAGRAPRVVARLPTPVRYAAVTAAEALAIGPKGMQAAMSAGTCAAPDTSAAEPMACFTEAT